MPENDGQALVKFKRAAHQRQLSAGRTTRRFTGRNLANRPSQDLPQLLLLKTPSSVTATFSVLQVQAMDPAAVQIVNSAPPIQMRQAETGALARRSTQKTCVSRLGVLAITRVILLDFLAVIHQRMARRALSTTQGRCHLAWRLAA